MNDLLLERFAFTPEFGTFGVLFLKDFWWYSLEREWANNAVNISCIPEGVYTIQKDWFYTEDNDAYPCYQVMDVPGRTLIKIHVANIVTQLKGCIALGVDLGWYKGMWSIIHSRRAMDQFMAAMNSRDIATLKISHINNLSTKGEES